MNTSETEQFYVVGNNLALDFVNSITSDLTPKSLVDWAVAVNLIDTAKAKGLLLRWDETNLAEISEFRKDLREAVINLSDGGEIKQRELSLINRVLRQSSGYSELLQTPEGFAKKFEIDLSEPKKILVPIAESIADLLCYGNLDYLRNCENPPCFLYFYDTTKNHKRRWCSMAVCGNRAKAAKFYQRKKGSYLT